MKRETSNTGRAVPVPAAIIAATLAAVLVLAGCQTTGGNAAPEQVPVTGPAAPAVLENYAGVSFTPPPGATQLSCREPDIPAYRWSWACTMAHSGGRIIRIEFWRDVEPDEAEMRDWLARYFFRPATANFSSNISFVAERRQMMSLADGRQVEAVFGRGRQQSSGDTSHRIAILIIPAAFNSAGRTMSLLFGRNQWQTPGVTPGEVQRFLDGMRFPKKAEG
ncbi:hypothetical protein [Minwuia sp.]|uniref:hypothetical protein n=1 Tax=Minwuia sp. TaxID=2493630 RepID=UPI003A8E0819